jgi:hypothetical protein
MGISRVLHFRTSGKTMADIWELPIFNSTTKKVFRKSAQQRKISSSTILYATQRYVTQCYATQCYTTQYYATQCYATQCYAVLRSATQCYAVLRSATQCYAVLRSATQFYAMLLSLFLVGNCSLEKSRKMTFKKVAKSRKNHSK